MKNLLTIIVSMLLTSCFNNTDYSNQYYKNIRKDIVKGHLHNCKETNHTNCVLLYGKKIDGSDNILFSTVLENSK